MKSFVTVNRNDLFHGFVKRVQRRISHSCEQLRKARLRYSSISRQRFIEDLKTAVDKKTGYAAGKIGISQKHWMYYEIVRSKERNFEKIKRFEELLKFHALKQEGVFPEDLNFYLDFNRFYINHVKNLDCLGLFYQPAGMELELIRHYRLINKLIYYVNQEPDRSQPSNDDNCYLPFFRDKKVLFVCPFAEFLRDRAVPETFEKVWSKTGKQWFSPKSVDAVEFPYGFSPETHRKYSTVLELFEDIVGKIREKDFDIALIGAAGLAIPVASFVKDLGKIGIDLGGALQFFFGVRGKRWDAWKEFQENYFNDWWVHLPEKYRPDEEDVCDKGAYW